MNHMWETANMYLRYKIQLTVTDLLLYFIFEVHICLFSRVIHDDLLILISCLLFGLVCPPEDKINSFWSVMSVASC